MLKKLSIKLLRWLLITAAAVVILFAVALNAARIFLPLLDHKRVFIEQWVSNAIHQPVTIGKIEGGWSGFEPQLTLENVRLRKRFTNNTVIKIHRLSVGIDLWHSLLEGKILPGHLTIEGTQFDIMQDKNGKLWVRGVTATTTKHKKSASPTAFKDMVLWLLTQADVSVKNVSVNFYASDHSIFQFRGLQLSVINNLLDHKIDGVVRLKQTIPTQLKFNIDLEKYDLQKDTFNAKAYIQVEHLVLQQLMTIKPLQRLLKGIHISSGTANAQAWLQWDGTHPQSVHSIFNFKQVGVQFGANAKTKKHVMVNNLSANVQWLKFSNGWGLKADNVKVRVKGGRWHESKLGYRVINNKVTHTEQHLLRVGFVRLHDLHAFISSLKIMPAQLNHLYQKWKPSGDLSDMTFDFSVHQHHMKLRLLTSHFAKLGFTLPGKKTALSGLTGRVYYTPTHGWLSLDTQQSSANLPHLFKGAFPLDKLNALLKWRKHDGRYTFQLANLSLINQHFQLRGAAHVYWQPKHSPYIDLMLNYNMQDLRYLKYYLPSQLLSPSLAHWLSTSFVGGQLKDGVLVLRGRLNQFPYAKHQGVFEATAQLNNVTLHFLPTWPEMTHLNARMSFNDLKLKVNATSANLGGNQLHHLHARIDNLQHVVLHVDAQSKTTLNKGLAFLRKTPLDFVRHLSDLQLNGPMNLKVGLRIPFLGNNTHVYSYGTIGVANGSMYLSNLDMRINHIKGQLKFANSKFSSDRLAASYLGMPFVASVATVSKNRNNFVHIKLQGKMGIDALKKHYNKVPIWRYLSGVANYNAMLVLPENTKHSSNRFSLSSNMQGITVAHMPPHFNKPAGIASSFNMQINFKKNMMRMAYNYAQKISAALSYKKIKNQMQLYSLAFRLGSTQADYQAVPGMVVFGDLRQLDWDKWRNFVDELVPNDSDGKATEPGLKLRFIQLQVNRLKIFSQVWPNMSVRIVPDDTGYMFHVHNHNVAGAIHMPKGKYAPWRLNLQRLYLTKQKSDGSSTLKPQEIPSLDVRIQDFMYDGKKLGKVNLQTRALKDGLRIKLLEIQNPIFGLKLNGDWQIIKGVEQTSVYGGIKSNDYGSMLDNWGISKDLAETKGGVNFALDWPGSPLKFSTKHLSGDVKMYVADGRILGISKSTQSELGLGRLINLFSLESLSRNLALNFGDLGKKGFKFDTFEADFKMHNGNAVTQGAVMRGSVAKILLKGRIGFAKKDYDVYMQVQPHLTSSLPLIVGIAGGPIAGAVTWVVNKIVSPTIGKAAAFTYKITGSWDKPVVKKLEAGEKVDFVPVETR